MVRLNLIGRRPTCFGDRHLLKEDQLAEWCTVCSFLEGCKERTMSRHSRIGESYDDLIQRLAYAHRRGHTNG